MNIKRFIISVIAVFVAFELFDFLIHFIIMSKQYSEISSIWRPDMNNLMWIMYISVFIFCLLFVYIFIKGYEGKGIIEGVRFGIIIGLFMNIPGSINQYVIYPIPFIIVLQWFIYGMIEFVICGIIVSLIYKPK